jgi:adenine-specific DNA-methyltransferase
MAGKVGKPAGSTPVTATRHAKETRVNIPTAELESFARDEDKAPTTLLYPRDQSLDPQLVWKGKDEQDREDLAVPVVPVYIQEQIEPRAIIEELRSQTAGRRDAQLDLFSDFNGLDFEERVEFYRHPMKWTNRMILGDSLRVMASLAEKEGLKGKFQTIYLDPPYGIKFGSNWQVSTRKRDVRDGKAEDVTRQREQVRAFRDTWELGIHSYLAYLRDRLILARDLLTESGSIFVQIGDENVHLVRNLLDEVFGAENFVSLVSYRKASGAGSFNVGTNVLPSVADYVLWFARDLAVVKYRQLYSVKESGGAGAGKYTTVELPDGTRRPATGAEITAGTSPGRFMRLDNLTSQTTRVGLTTVFPVDVAGRTFTPAVGGWKTNTEGMARLGFAGRLAPTSNTLSYVRYLDDFAAFPLTNIWTDIGGIQSRADPKVYVVQTATTAIERCLLMTTDPGDLVLDPTCGSGTTAYVAEQWGRRWITIDTSRVAVALARTRLMAARYPYFVLADSPDGREIEAKVSGQAPVGGPTEGDIRRGFVYERVPHVTLKSIAQNPEIREGMSPGEIGAAITRHADTELLYDRPVEDRRIVRVAGPFTVESLSPHRVVSDGPEDAAAAAFAPLEEGGRFVATILSNLRTSGVDNRVKGERLRFVSLEPFPGTWIQAEGFYDEAGTTKRAAVALGPEFGTVGAELVREAAKEAAKGGFDLLVVCGFAFDASVGEQAGAMGRLTILRAAMNPDLAMGEELLKKTRSGNLFTVFGEPDISVQHLAGDAGFTVTIHGLDVYDPTTGEIRSNSTTDIACWFVDTDYNGEAFFVRHAYFLGGDEPYDNLKRTLRAEIDEAAWSSLYSNVSRLFPQPTSGQIAVKVINHYGDEVMKVYDVR